MMAVSRVPFTPDMFNDDHEKEMISAIAASIESNITDEATRRMCRESAEEYAKQLAKEQEKIEIRTREIAEEQRMIQFRLKELEESIPDHSEYFAERTKWNEFIDLYYAELEACHTIYRLDCLNAPKKLFDNRYNDWEAYNRDWNLSDQERREHDDELYVLYRAKRANLECLIDWGVKNRDIGTTFLY